MKLCTACRRHVRPLDPACPFCGEVLRTGGAGRIGAVVLLGALEAACGDKTPGGDGTGSTGSTGSTGGVGVSTTSATGSSTVDGSTSVVPTTTSATNTPGESSSASDPSEGDGGSTFYGAGPIDDFVGAECSLFLQDCPRGEKCAPFDALGFDFPNSAKCVPVAADPQPPGAACTIEGEGFTGVDDCELGAWCDIITLQCHALCAGTPDAPVCPDDFTCTPTFGDVLECLADCHPLNAACPMGEVCIVPLSSQDFVCVGDASGGAGQAMDACEFVNVCDPGLACVGSETVSEQCDPGFASCCTPFCDTAEPPDCPDPLQECVAFFMEDPPAGFETLGVCGLPPP